MKIGGKSIAGASVAVLAIQLLLVCSIAARYRYQRWRCPEVWTRSAAFDPDLPMRGRYLSLQVEVDGCQSTLPSAKQAEFPRDVTGAVKPGPYALHRFQVPVRFQAGLKVEKNRLLAVRLQNEDGSAGGQTVNAWPGRPCDDMTLAAPLNFYIAEHAAIPLPLKSGQELWMEVTVPPKGPPRPVQLALKQNGMWKPLAFE